MKAMAELMKAAAVLLEELNSSGRETVYRVSIETDSSDSPATLDVQYLNGDGVLYDYNSSSGKFVPVESD